jgi:AraC-like DNA-binding protein
MISEFTRNLPPKSERVDVAYSDDNLISALAKRFGIEFLKALALPIDAATPHPHADQQVFLPAEIGSGWVRNWVVRSGLEVMMMDMSLKRPTLVRGNNAPTLIEIGFWQMGRNVRYRFDFGEGITQPNQVSLASIPMPYEGESLYPCDERIMGISLSIAPDIFGGWLTDHPLPQPLHQRLTDTAQVTMFQQQIPAALKLPLAQLRDRTWQGSMSRLYAEAKVMEIVALYAQHLAAETPSDQPNLTHDDIERLHQAKAMLLSRLDDPPSLTELARAVHLNEHKLKLGFKAVFSTTVFGMLYDHRMAQARDLIESRCYSITEVVLQVGYRSPSAFSAAFKRKYGVTPSDMQP